MGILVAPTENQLANDPVVTLLRPGWNRGSGWSPHGFAYKIRFNGGKATVLKSHLDQIIATGGLKLGITIDDGVAPVEFVTAPKVVTVCPVCEASGDEPCVTASGNITKAPHKTR